MTRFRPSVAIRGLALSLLLPALLTTAPTLPVAQEKERGPARVGLEEEVQVRIIQVELTAWPRKDNPEVCLDLEASDFELLVNGMPREILAVDRLHAYGRLLPDSMAMANAEAAGGEGDLKTTASLSPESPAQDRDPMQFVFYFDILHLNQYVIEIPEEIRARAVRSVERMLTAA